MFKVLGGVFLGVFVGALALEVLRRLRPDMVEAIERRARGFTESVFKSLHGQQDSFEEEV